MKTVDIQYSDHNEEILNMIVVFQGFPFIEPAIN